MRATAIQELSMRQPSCSSSLRGKRPEGSLPASQSGDAVTFVDSIGICSIAERHSLSPSFVAAHPAMASLTSEASNNSRSRGRLTQGPAIAYNTLALLTRRSKYRQNAFASCICLGLWHSGPKRRAFPITTQRARALEVATFKRFRLWRNSIPRGASSGDDVVRE